MCSQIKAAFSSYTFQWADIKYRRTLMEQIATPPTIVLARRNMSEMTTTKLTPKVQHPKRTKKFMSSIDEALDHFDDQIGSLDETIRTNAYKTLLNSYKEALTPIWNLARFADVEIILKTIADREMTSLADMARKLQPPPVTAKVSTEKRKVPDLETISSTFKDWCPSQNIPDNEVCKQIADVFFKLVVAHKAYGRNGGSGIPHYTRAVHCTVGGISYAHYPSSDLGPDGRAINSTHTPAT